MTKLFNRATETEKRRILRHQIPEAEVILWSCLKGRQLLGHKFRRQYSIGGFIVDFYCPHVKLAIELDGSYHFTEEARVYDRGRQELIEAAGIHVLRFTNQRIQQDLKVVLEEIRNTVLKLPTLTKTNHIFSP